MSNKLKAKKLKFQVVKVGDHYRVRDNKGVFMTKDCPKEVADGIACDFNKMSKRDFTPIGLPDLSHTIN